MFHSTSASYEIDHSREVTAAQSIVSFTRSRSSVLDSVKAEISVARFYYKKVGKLLFITIALFLSPLEAVSDPYHFQNILVGDRAAGLGGAYVAIADDPTGLYYNPSGIVYAVGSNLSASMNALHYSQTRYARALGNETWVRTSTALLPNFFGVIQPFGPGILGFSYAVPDSTIENQQQKFNLPDSVLGPDTEFTINFNNQDILYNVGPSYAIKLNEKISLGLTVYGVAHQQRQIFNQEFLASSGYHWENAYINTQEYGIKPLLGLMWSPYDMMSLGATFSRGYHLYTKSTFQQSCARNNTATYGDTSLCQNGKLNLATSVYSSRNIAQPWNLKLGAAFFPSRDFLFTLNLDLYENTNKSDAQIQQNFPLANYSGGLEYYFIPNYAFRAGMYTNFANTPLLRDGLVDQSDHIDLYGFTLSLTNFTRSSSLTGGFNFSTGAGKAQVVSGKPSMQDVQVFVVTLYLSASYSY